MLVLIVSELSKAKKKAWDVFSKYIRLRDALKTTNAPFSAKCVTCGREYDLNRGLQAGHFIPGRRNSILFDERNVHAQCYGCNVMKKGNPIEYWKFMEKEYGREIIDELDAKNYTTRQIKQFEFEEIAKTYSEKLKQLENNQRL